MIQSRRWRELRRRVLTSRPCCERCAERGLVTAAREVHHVLPVEHVTGPAAQEGRMFDPLNLMALCHACHVAVHEEMGRSGREAVRARNATRSASAIARFFGESIS